MSRSPRLHAIPGMGADHRMFPSPWDSLPGFKAWNWPEYQGDHTLPDLANRLIAAYGIEPGDSIIGASLGGMVGCEIALKVPLRRLFLVGSAIHPGEIYRLHRWLHPVSRFTPFRFLQRIAARIPSRLTEGFATSEPEFLRAMCAAIFAWNGVPKDPLQQIRIHGRSDWIIRFPSDANLALDGGHFISMTHAEECVRFIRSKLPADA